MSDNDKFLTLITLTEFNVRQYNPFDYNNVTIDFIFTNYKLECSFIFLGSALFHDIN